MMFVTLRGVKGEVVLSRAGWVAALLLVGLHSGWSCFRHGPGRLNAEEARQFADGLQRCLDRLPDEDAREDRFVFWGGGKDRLRRLITFARSGPFGWRQ